VREVDRDKIQVRKEAEVGRQTDAARLAGVGENDVQEVSVQVVRQALANRLPALVLQVATAEPATYWRVGERYFLDDPSFGEVVDMEQLDYDAELGLFIKRSKGC
jgi:hypothetical protein